MGNLILDNISLIILLPLWIFLIIMCGRFFSVYVHKSIISVLTLLSSFAGAVICFFSLINFDETMIWINPFIKINEFSVPFGLLVDKISLVAALVLFVVSFAVQLFSVSYMKDEKKSYKFFAFLNLFNFSMAGLIFSPNLFQFYVFWELISAVSYLLIAFDYKDETKSLASKRVFIINRIGDTALIAGVILTSYFMFSYADNYTFSSLLFEDLGSISALLLAYVSNPVYCIICGLFILAAAVKSAQFPFYTWLQDAMEAKTPVSALLHSATMVAAGVYLVIKLMPFFVLNEILLNTILYIGLITAVICSVLASIETQSKKVLAYSTSANLGLMFTALGAGNIKIALMLFIVHAFVKSALFILLPKENSMSKINFILFALFALTLCGVLLSGIGVKELLYKNLVYFKALPIILLAVCFISAFYISRLAILLYKNNELTKEKNLLELMSFLILLFGNVVIYILISGSYKLAEPYAAAIGGLCLALLLGRKDKLEIINKTPKLMEKFANNFAPFVYSKISEGLNYAEKNVLSEYKPILFVSKACVCTVNWLEENVMNKSVELIRDISKRFSKTDKYLQSGNVQTYNAYAFILLAIVIALVITGYRLIFG